jgi:hypothetical protein
MKRILNLTVLALAAFLLLGTLPVLAVERPFALSGQGVATFITDEAGNPIAATTTGSLNATHLGSCTVSGTVNFTPDPEHPGRLLSSGSGTITAANGDTLLFELNGALDPPAPGSTSAIDKPVFRWVGGTGRFVGASGSGNGVVVVNLLTGAFDITVVGDIEY